MDLGQFAATSSSQPQPEEKAIIESLKLRLSTAKQLVREGKFQQGRFRMWLGLLKRDLTKIYGDNAFKEIPYVFKQIPDLKEKVPPDILTKVENEAIEALGAFISSLHADFETAFGMGGGGNVFIGHGRSPLWRELKDFINDRLGLPWDEFNREAVAGLTTFERISAMLVDANFAFLIMTAEDEHADSSLHARENVVHEVGLFQGKLGPRKAIILLEEGCKEFSNIVGLSQLRFPKGHISAVFEEIRRILEREKII